MDASYLNIQIVEGGGGVSRWMKLIEYSFSRRKERSE